MAVAPSLLLQLPKTAAILVSFMLHIQHLLMLLKMWLSPPALLFLLQGMLAWLLRLTVARPAAAHATACRGGTIVADVAAADSAADLDVGADAGLSSTCTAREIPRVRVSNVSTPCIYTHAIATLPQSFCCDDESFDTQMKHERADVIPKMAVLWKLAEKLSGSERLTSQKMTEVTVDLHEAAAVSMGEELSGSG